MATDFRVVLVTVPEGEPARKLAEGLVESKLAACVNLISQVNSIFRWEGKIDTAKESLLIIKTRSGILPTLIHHVKENHPYKTPEIISLTIDEGNPEYLDWIGANTIFVKPAEKPNLPL